MLKVLKFQIGFPGDCKVEFPGTPQILSAGIQVHEFGGKSLVIWALCQSDSPYTTTKNISVVGTGLDLEVQPGKFIATVHDARGYVWHVFENE